MSFAIVFRTYPDVDHMVPLAWRLAEDGEEVHAIVSPGYDAARDHHLRFVAGHPGVHLTEIAPPGRRGPLARIAAHLRGTVPYAMLFLRRHRVEVVAVEWGYGLADGYDRLRTPAGLLAVLRSVGRSLLHGSDRHQARTSFIVAARLLGRATVCLPHGLNLKLDTITTSEGVSAGVNGYDWSDRNRFSAYAVNTAHHLDWHLRHAGGDPDVMHAWGTMRWAPDWIEINRGLTEPFEWPEAAGDRLKVTLMVPKWRNRLHKDAAISLVERLNRLDFVSLALKGHPRPEDGAADPLRAEAQLDWSRIHDVTAVDSVPLIAASDVVVDVGNSIGMEVVTQGKVLVYPTYVHELTTVYDEIPGCCVLARTEDEVADYLEAHAAGRMHEVPPEAYERLMRWAVFAGRDEPYDVIGLYSERVRELAVAGAKEGRP
jgi:hypothetical protein